MTRIMLVPTSAPPPPDRVQRVAVLGSTGSVGRQTLDVIDQHPDRFEVVALAAGTPSDGLRAQIARYRPPFAVTEQAGWDTGVSDTRSLSGVEGLVEIATSDLVDIVVVASSGHAGILPTARAIEAGKIVALANKESLVCAGELIAERCRRFGVGIRPVDSEHSAIWQALGRSGGDEIERLVLTASGGPFRDRNPEELAHVTIADALHHPTWTMGEKITIDSATMMNKGLEVIEAHLLFGVPYDRIDVVIHPESIVHSLVAFADGGQIGQLSLPDMRLPIQYALTYPSHVANTGQPLDLTAVGQLRFSKPDPNRFPALAVARAAGSAGQTCPTVLCAADEIAVAAFVAGRISFTGIVEVVRRTLDRHVPWPVDDFDAVTAADDWTRRTAEELIELAATA